MTVTVDDNGKINKPRISGPGQMECLKFLTLCGFVFPGVDLRAKTPSISETHVLEASYPDDPIMLTGLKALAVAEVELRTARRFWNDHHILRCNYWLLKEESSDVLDILLGFMHPLPESVRRFIAELHKRYTGMGMNCVIITDNQNHFAYSFIKDSKRTLTPRDIYYLRIWEFSYSLRHGYCLVVRAKNTDKYADVINRFPISLRDLIARGYGCDRKLRNERCQGGCQGFRISLDESIIKIRDDIIEWIDNEISSHLR